MTTEQFARMLAGAEVLAGRSALPFDQLPVEEQERHRAAAGVLLASVHTDDTDLTEADVDRMMAAGTPVQIVTAPPSTFAAVPSAPADRRDIKAVMGPADGQQKTRLLADLYANTTPVPAPSDRAALRDRIAALFRCPPGVERLGDATPGEIADAVLAVLPASLDQAAEIRSGAFKTAALYVRGHSADERYGHSSISTALCMVSDELARMADETQQPEAQPCPSREPLIEVQCSKQEGHEGPHSDQPGRIWYPVLDDETQQGEPQPDTPRCAHCTHPKGDHSDRKDHTPSRIVPRRPWCHACDAVCDYDGPPAVGAQQPKEA